MQNVFIQEVKCLHQVRVQWLPFPSSQDYHDLDNWSHRHFALTFLLIDLHSYELHLHHLQGGCATFLCQPLDVLKTRLMNSKGEYTVSGSFIITFSFLILSSLNPGICWYSVLINVSVFRGWCIAYEKQPNWVHSHFTR